MLTQSLDANRTTQTHTATVNVTTSTASESALDLATVVKASLAISREIELDKLLACLMKILLRQHSSYQTFINSIEREPSNRTQLIKYE